jgi:hypothetical protein
VTDMIEYYLTRATLAARKGDATECARCLKSAFAEVPDSKALHLFFEFRLFDRDARDNSAQKNDTAE